jgi:uncharacterized protein YecT (DUF1311 family)
MYLFPLHSGKPSVALLLAAAFSFSSEHQALAASFGCALANNPVEMMICAGERLGAQDEILDKEYRITQTVMPPAEREALKRNQREWLKRRIKECKIQSVTDLGSSEKSACLFDKTADRIDVLKHWAQLGQTTQINNSPSAKKVCSQLLAKSNIRWLGKYDGVENFEVVLPSDFVEPEWARLPDAYQDHARFDFTNEGHPSDVYVINEENTHFLFRWYIVAAADESAKIEERLIGMIDEVRKGKMHMEVLEQFANDLAHTPVGQRGIFPTANTSSMEGERKSPLASRLFDTSNTEIYSGWYTRSTVVRHQGKTYVIAQSVNNLAGPTAAIFQPSKDKLELLCYHQALRSHDKLEIRHFNENFPCPAKLESKTVDWITTDQGWTNRAIIDIPEWGGKRPVKMSLETAGGHWAYTRLYVGDVGEKEMQTDRNWEPLTSLNEIYDSVSLFPTKSGYYILASNIIESGAPDENISDNYFRITEKGLVPVCYSTITWIAPTGYLVK